MNVPTPKFFVLDEEGLHGYDREDLLKCDLVAPSMNPANHARQIFRLNETGLTTSYSPITLSELGIHSNSLVSQSNETQPTSIMTLRHAA